VTTIATKAETAEIDAKVVLISGNAAATQLPALLTERDGTELMVNDFEAYRW
jgi:hypothetical protein